MNQDSADRIGQIAADRTAAGLLFVTPFTSPLPTVTPPAGTLRAEGRDIKGEFDLPDGRQAVTLDSWGSQASRMETAVERVAEDIGYPLIRLVGQDGTVLTTSARLSHRQADATWRAAHQELTTAGVPFEDIRDATVEHADALLRWFPTAILFGWWHSHVRSADRKKMADKRKAALKAVGGDPQVADALEGYAKLGPQSRSARVITSEIIATGVSRRLRFAARSDSLFGPLKGGEKGESGKSEGPSALGLGSLPPVQEARAPVDVTFDAVEGRWFLSLAGLRRFGFADADTATARTLLVALGLLLREEALLETRLRAGTELVASVDGARTELLRRGAQTEELPHVDSGDLRDIVRDLGARVGWDGARDVLIPDGSVLHRLMHKAAEEQAD